MLNEKFVRFHLDVFKPFLAGCSLKTARDSQDKLGALMATIHKNSVTFKECNFDEFECSFALPTDELWDGVMLYLHGGGYTCGDIEYAKGVGATLACECGIKVMCPAYRLAPEAPFPAAVEDALTAYKYLLQNGVAPEKIVLCGESAGGGLIYALCLKLKQEGIALPSGLIAMSPWTDLTMSGQSFEKNREIDPSLTRERLVFYSDCYCFGDNENHDENAAKNPLISPLFGDLKDLPPSLIIVGGDEILLDDSVMMNKALKKAGCRSSLVVTKGMWHAYVLYCLDGHENDFDRMNKFLKTVLGGQKKLRWMRLDNAAKIYPAIRTKQWTNYFRMSATLKEPVDRDVLRSALDVTVRRFPSIAVRLRRGMFWYYLEEIRHAPEIEDEKPYPMYHTPFDDIRKCAFRVLVYNNRIAVEFFHAITDGNGGLIFLKTLVAEYISQKYGITITPDDGVLDRLETPKEEELEDSFLKYSSDFSAKRAEPNAFKITGTPELDGFLTNTTLISNQSLVHELAKEYGVSVTEFLAAVMMKATIDLQEQTVLSKKRRKDVRILIPVNLRRLFDSKTMRNFAYFATVGVDARLGNYSLSELCSVVHHQMGTQVTPKQMSMQIAANVNIEKIKILQFMPLFIKNIAMKLVYNMIGERKSCFNISNLGIVKLPDEMKPYVTRLDFVLNVQAYTPYNIGVLTYDGKVYVNFTRNIKEPLLEKRFYDILHELGVDMSAECNKDS